MDLHRPPVDSQVELVPEPFEASRTDVAKRTDIIREYSDLQRKLARPLCVRDHDLFVSGYFAAYFTCSHA